MGTAKFLYWLGIVVIIFEVVGNLYTFNFPGGVISLPSRLITLHNFSLVASAFFQGGTLIGLGKILERLHQR